MVDEDLIEHKTSVAVLCAQPSNEPFIAENGFVHWQLLALSIQNSLAVRRVQGARLYLSLGRHAEMNRSGTAQRDCFRNPNCHQAAGNQTISFRRKTVSASRNLLISLKMTDSNSAKRYMQFIHS